MSKKRKRRGLAGVGAFLGTLLVMAELVGGAALPADLVSFIESGKTVWVGGVAVLLSASWLIYDLSENGWADRPVLETVLRYSDCGLFPEPNELASLLRDPKCIEMLKEMSADPWGSIISTATLGMSPEEQKHRAEQHRITTKVDELMALCDRLEEARFVHEGTRDRLLDSLLHEVLLADDATAERPTQFNWLPGERHD